MAWSHWKTSVVTACGDGFGARKGIHSIQAEEQQEGVSCRDQQNYSWWVLPWHLQLLHCWGRDGSQRKDLEEQCQRRGKIWVWHDGKATDNLCHGGSASLSLGYGTVSWHKKATGRSDAAVCLTLTFFFFFLKMTLVCTGHSGLKYLPTWAQGPCLPPLSYNRLF